MIPHNRPTMGKEEIEAAVKTISNASLSQGREVESFENEFCKYLGYGEGHAIAVSSGSAALYMAIRAIDTKKKITKVGIPAYSCSALKNAVELAEKIPVFADVEMDSPNIDLSDKRLLSTDTIIACHIFGIPKRIEDDDIIEDCAQAIGAVCNGKKVGTQTNISVFSFYATKPMTSGGEGGMVVSKDEEVIEYIRDLRDFDMKNDNKKRFNFQMTDLQASIGRVQLKRLDEFIEKRKQLADRYSSSGISLWRKDNSMNFYRGIVESKNPRKLIEYLYNNGIKAIIPIEADELLCDRKRVPRAYELTQSLVSIPLFPSLNVDGYHSR